MYRGQYNRPTPPGYSGVAFPQKQEEEQENAPTPVGNGAGEINGQKMKNEILHPPSASASIDRRNEVKAMPREFSGVVETQEKNTEQKGAAETELLSGISAFLTQKFSLEELLLLGTAFLLATKEEKKEAFPVFALALMLMDT